MTPGYSGDEFEEEDPIEDAAKEVDPDDLTNKYVVSMGGDEGTGLTASADFALSSIKKGEADSMEGTSKFGGGEGVRDSFDDAFDKGDEGKPPQEEEELEDFMVKPKPKRQQWGV